MNLLEDNRHNIGYLFYFLKGGIPLIKKLLILFLIVLISYVTYYDITFGTFQNTSTKEVSTDSTIIFQTVEIKSGDTLLSLVEQLSHTNIPSVDIIIGDFQKLNNGLKPNNLQVSRTYKIPIYK